MSNQIALPGALSPDVTWPIPAVIIRAPATFSRPAVKTVKLVLVGANTKASQRIRLGRFRAIL